MNMSRFDWYQASFPEDARMGALDLLALHGDEAPKRIKGMHGYHRGWEIRREGSTLCKVFEGEGLTDHVLASGADSPEIAGALKRHVPQHRVARADVCLDFQQGPGLFSDLRSLMFARLKGAVTLSEWIETGPKETSATLYAGSRQSDVRVRLYEKGKQDTTYDHDTVRLELQARPKKDRKSYAAGIEPGDYWGLARWSRKLVEEVTGMAVPAAPARSERVTDLQGSMNAMTAQYGGRLLEYLAFHEGDLESFALGIVNAIGQLDAGTQH